MTEEKEIAEKVWGWFEKEVRSALKNDDGIPYEGTMALIETNLEKILPRPKKKVRAVSYTHLTLPTILRV